MAGLRHRRELFVMAVATGLSVIFWSAGPLRAEQPRHELCEEIKQMPQDRDIDFPTPDDPRGQQEAFERVEWGLAKLRLTPADELAPLARDQHRLTDLLVRSNEPQWRQEIRELTDRLTKLRDLLPLAEKELKLKECKERLAESQAFLQLLDRVHAGRAATESSLAASAEWTSVRETLLDRITQLQDTTDRNQQIVRAEEELYRRALTRERQALADLLAGKRSELLIESLKRTECRAGDRPCLERQLNTLCQIRFTSSDSERLHIMRLIGNIVSRLDNTGQAGSANCEDL
ncbi:MAG: hypothetical protein FIA90_01770 [candidate division NC10 bacterium]|nr:hypothetical protein [candidate division NC10 bacterium]